MGFASAAVPSTEGAPLAQVWVAERELAPGGEGWIWDEGVRTGEGGERELRVLVPAHALEGLRVGGVRVEIVRTDHRLGPPAEGYTLPGEGEAVLRGLAAIAPRGGYAQVGLSREGRPLHALWLGQAPDAPGATSVRLLGAHHGDELASSEVVLGALEDLAARDGTDAAVTALLDRATVWGVPWVNPDGVMAGSRVNAAGIDLNRNYDFRWSDSAYGAGAAPFSEPEVQAVRALASLDRPYLSLSLHSGETNIGYVWNWTAERTGEDQVLLDLATAYGDACAEEGFWVTNGADWYMTQGDTNDWSYGRYGGMDFTLEVTRQKRPDPASIPFFVGAHVEAIRGFLTTPPSLSLRVVDGPSGEPVEAELRAAGAVVAVDPVSGALDRVGAEEGWVVAPGYLPAAIGGSGEVALERAGLSWGRPEPARVRQGQVDLRLPGAPDGAVTLWRAGDAGVTGQVRQQQVSLDLTALAPGPWSLLFADGAVWPRALLVEDFASPLEAVARLDDALVLTGGDWLPGTRVYSLGGALRGLRPLAVLEEGEHRLVLALPDASDGAPTDVLVWSGGRARALLDVTGALDADTSPSPDTGVEDTGPDWPGARPEAPRSCGCGALGARSLWFWPALLLLRRRRT